MSGERLLALVTDAFGGYGGIAQYNRDFITAASASAAVAEVVVLPRIAPDPVGGLPAKVRQLQPVSGRFRYSLSAVRQALAQRPSMVFCGHLFHIDLASLIARLTGAKLIVQLHGIDIWGDITPARCRALESAALILTVSRDTRSRVRAKTSIDPTKIIVLNNMVGDDFFPGDRRVARARFGLGDEVVVLTVSQLNPRIGYKGHERVMPLIAQLHQAGQAVVYLIAGIGDDRSRLEGVARALGLVDQVRFLGHVPRAAQVDLYRAADIFALPSTGEGFGIVFVEAMACGTPAIGLAVGGAPDALGDGELGVCVAPEAFDEAFLAMTNGDIDRDPTLADRVRARFGWPLFRSQVDVIIRHLSGRADDPGAGGGA